MKQFLKMTLATICGIAIFLVIAGFFFMISLVGMLAGDSASTKVKDNSVFVINLNGSISERSEEETPFDEFMGLDDMSSVGLDDMIRAIRKAKDNDNIKGIYLEGGSLGFDAPATAQQLRDALKDFKKSGKWIVAYADQYYQASYYVATVADNIYLNDHGSIDFKGLGGKGEYYKGLYDKLGIKYQVAKVGKYKSYVLQLGLFEQLHIYLQPLLHQPYQFQIFLLKHLLDKLIHIDHIVNMEPQRSFYFQQELQLS
jgi:protease-4